MNPYLDLLQAYPFEKLKKLFAGIAPNPEFSAISLGLGEPKHPTPQLIKDALTANLNGLANYPSTVGSDSLRHTISQWLARRYQIPALDISTEILPVNGSREALFSLTQAVIDPTKNLHGKPIVMCPNPFYQIYEGAAYLAGAEPYFVNADPKRNFVPDYSGVTDEIWERTQLLFVCSPGNPTGAVLTQRDWEDLFELAEKHNFIIAADECYSEIYFGEEAPLGSLSAAQKAGVTDYSRLVTLSSLSKRSNVPGMRSGFVAGDAKVIKQFLLYRTYHGGAMSPTVQAASVAAWDDEDHVLINREMYRTKFAQVTPILADVLDVKLPDAAFYLWAGVDKHLKISDTEFAQGLYRDYNVTVLPGSYLARDAHGFNPGRNRIRMALVAEVEECMEAAQRIAAYTQKLMRT